MEFVGRFNEEDLRNGIDKAEVAKAKARYGLGYTDTELVFEDGVPVGIKIWVCDKDEFKL